MSTPRRAFTLIEMLVVLIIIMALAAIVVALSPRIERNRLVSQGADTLQGTLAIARQRARRDQLPSGVRLNPDGNGLVRELQYIQVPDDFNGGTVAVKQNNLAAVVGQGVDFTGGQADPRLQPVQVGDYIELKGGGLVRRITGVTAGALALQSPLTLPVQPTGEYRIIRKARILSGETAALLPKDIAIDLGTNTTYKAPLFAGDGGTVDLVFMPNGALVDQPGSLGIVPLWVRDATLVNVFDGEPAIICIYVRTGAVAAHPPDPVSGDPYSFARDGRSSGL